MFSWNLCCGDQVYMKFTIKIFSWYFIWFLVIFKLHFVNLYLNYIKRSFSRMLCLPLEIYTLKKLQDIEILKIENFMKALESLVKRICCCFQWVIKDGASSYKYAIDGLEIWRFEYLFSAIKKNFNCSFILLKILNTWFNTIFICFLYNLMEWYNKPKWEKKMNSLLLKSIS